jgi:3-hydroxyisobutyrate dehydrogenase-like beta-hydroxyacid dehydrogenase
MSNIAKNQNRNSKTVNDGPNNCGESIYYMNITIFGLGIIGSRCADKLEAAGHHVTRWNRTAKSLPNEVRDPLEAAEASEILSFYLKDATAIREVITSISPALKAGKTVLNHSTIDLNTTMWLADYCQQHGCEFVDAPFTGSKLAAADGKLLYYIAGEENLLNRVETILAPTASAIIPMGAVGNATVMKLATNLIAACNIQALAEAQAISLHHGISAEQFLLAISKHGTASPLTMMKLPSMLAGDFDTHFSLDNMRKDSVYALQLAMEQGISLPAMETVSARMTDLCAEGLAERDYTALVAPYFP